MNKWRLLLSNAYRFFYPIDPVEKYKRMGVKIGRGCKFQFEVVIDYAHYWLITIGDDVTLAPRVHILAHDASTKTALGYTRIAKVNIGSRVFIGAGTIILPGVSIGDDVIIGAGSVVTHDIPAGSVAAGNPVLIIGTTADYLNKHKDRMNNSPLFDESYTLRVAISEEKKQEMIEKLATGPGYVV